MKSKISDEQLADLCILAKLELDCKESEQIRKELNQILDYAEQLNRLDTEGIEPLVHPLPYQNALREDIPHTDTSYDKLLKNAAAQKDSCFVVPRTIQ